MAILIMPAKRVRKAKTRNSQEVLQRLQEFLEQDADTGRLVSVLCGFWEDQQEAVSYQELRQIVMDGTVSKEMLKLWSQDYSKLVANTLSIHWTAAAGAGISGQPIMDGLSFKFNTQKPGILNWISSHGAEFVTSCTEEQKKAVAALLTKKMADGHTVDELSRMIRPCIGLTEGQAKANARFYDNIVETLKKEHPRMKEESIRKKAQEAAMKYAERQHRYRAMTIAQTESAFAYNRGADEGIRQAQAQNLIGKVIKRWSTSGDDQVCAVCQGLEGMEAEMDKGFPFKGKLLFQGQDLLPPAHPRCACAVEYIEIEPPSAASPDGYPGNMTVNTGTEMQKLGEIDMERVDEALEYYENLLRKDAIENVLVIDNQGSVYHAQGDASGVNLGKINLIGAVITHNHPASQGIVSFGEDDFYFLRDNQNISELRCVNAEYDYRVSVLKDISEVVYNDIYTEAFQYFQEADFEIQHKAMEILRERGYVKYARKKADT